MKMEKLYQLLVNKFKNTFDLIIMKTFNNFQAISFIKILLNPEIH